MILLGEGWGVKGGPFGWRGQGGKSQKNSVASFEKGEEGVRKMDDGSSRPIS